MHSSSSGFPYLFEQGRCQVLPSALAYGLAGMRVILVGKKLSQLRIDDAADGAE